jgi:hypothetical protein
MCRRNLEGMSMLQPSDDLRPIAHTSIRLMVRPGELVVVQRGIRFKAWLI